MRFELDILEQAARGESVRKPIGFRVQPFSNGATGEVPYLDCVSNCAMPKVFAAQHGQTVVAERFDGNAVTLPNDFRVKSKTSPIPQRVGDFLPMTSDNVARLSAVALASITRAVMG